jgi:uncharacterized protein DUF4238
MTQPRRQHVLPQFYMRAFANDRAQINVFPRMGASGPTQPHTTGISNVLVERDFYTITGEEGEDSFILEEAFSQLEGAAAGALRVMLDEGLALSDDQRSAWSEFMAAQVTRGRHFREVTSGWVDKAMKGVLQVIASQAPDEYIERMSAEIAEQGDPLMATLKPERIRQALSRQRYSVVPSKEHLIELSFAAHEKLTDMFFILAWKLLRFPEPCLITSDHPVSYWHEPGPQDGLRGIGPLTAREIRIPLSPSVALLLTWPPAIDEVDDVEHEGDELIARCLNRDLLVWPASEQWLTSPDVARHPLPATAREWVAEWPRPWLESGSYG